jgi:Protein of unknown function with PCYCGC motif
MKNRAIGIIVVLIAVAGAAFLLMQPRVAREETRNAQVAGPAAAQSPHVETSHTTHNAQRIPAHYETTPPLMSLGQTLPPERFIGKTKEAYQVARKIPQTLAQLPCYCYCDQGVGHKSLHSCFEDEHAASCAVCVDEALLAYKLQTTENLTPKQVRDVIIEKYSSGE